MLDAIKQLVENNVINEDTQAEIMEAWESKLSEAKEELRTELREEFAQRYDHDKKVMVKALDKMVTEGLQAEIEEFTVEKAALAEDRVKFNKKMTEQAAKFNNFMVAKLAEEIKELRSDRQKQKLALEEVEKFVAKRLASEIREFAQDKREVVETKVKLVAEARNQLTKLKKRFVKESASKVEAHVKSQLKSELTSLREDIETARENSFGRRIFETFGSEFVSSFLNENAEVRKLKAEIDAKETKLAEAAKALTNAKVLNESKEKKIRMITESNKRQEVMTDLLSTLNEDKREVMSSLLESVQTNRLQNSFEKYLPAVLANKAEDATPSKKKVVTESRKAVTGDKTVNKVDEEASAEVIDIAKLAGLKV